MPGPWKTRPLDGLFLGNTASAARVVDAPAGRPVCVPGVCDPTRIDECRADSVLGDWPDHILTRSESNGCRWQQVGKTPHPTNRNTRRSRTAALGACSAVSATGRRRRQGPRTRNERLRGANPFVGSRAAPFRQGVMSDGRGSGTTGAVHRVLLAPGFASAGPSANGPEASRTTRSVCASRTRRTPNAMQGSRVRHRAGTSGFTASGRTPLFGACPADPGLACGVTQSGDQGPTPPTRSTSMCTTNPGDE